MKHVLFVCTHNAGRSQIVPMRSHVMTIAYGKASECLRAEHCDAVPA